MALWTWKELLVWRKWRGVTQDNLAHALGVHRNKVINWEKGVLELPQDLEKRCHDAFPDPVPFTYLMFSEWRYAHKLSQRRLAELLGVSTQTVFKWENGYTRLPKDIEKRLMTLEGW